jgi:hypothetical protein
MPPILSTPDLTQQELVKARVIEWVEKIETIPKFTGPTPAALGDVSRFQSQMDPAKVKCTQAEFDDLTKLIESYNTKLIESYNLYKADIGNSIIAARARGKGQYSRNQRLRIRNQRRRLRNQRRRLRKQRHRIRNDLRVRLNRIRSLVRLYFSFAKDVAFAANGRGQISYQNSHLHLEACDQDQMEENVLMMTWDQFQAASHQGILFKCSVTARCKGGITNTNVVFMEKGTGTGASKSKFLQVKCVNGRFDVKSQKCAPNCTSQTVKPFSRVVAGVVQAPLAAASYGPQALT